MMCFGSLCGDDEERRDEPKPSYPLATQAPPAQPQLYPPAAAANSPTHQITQSAIDVFLFSQKDDGEMGGIGYWQTANAYHAIVLHETYAGPRVLNDKIFPALDKVQARVPNFINEFNDDTLWWAHCLLALHRFVAGTPREGPLLNTLYAIWSHVARYQLPPGRHYLHGDDSHDMGGAVLWTSKQDEEQVNSITTALFASLSARMTLLVCPPTPQDPGQHAAHQYLAAAEAGLDWIFRECYREGDQVVLDGIKIRCGERVDWTFTYTTAATIMALVDLSEAQSSIASWGKQQNSTRELMRACDLAQAAMSREQWVDPATGVLVEKGAYGQGSHNPWENNDAVGFKSVLIRALAGLRQVIARGRWRDEFNPVSSEIDIFVKTQFKSLQEHDTNGNGQYGPWWNGPFEAPTGHSQLAVLDVMAAIHCVGP